jgi:hypothetical protein
MVFVFGSNLKGSHAAGTALYARRFFGAKMGVGEGLAGRSYAIPVRENPTTLLPLYIIRQHVDRFYDYAIAHPAKQFRVTRIGVTVSGYSDEQMAQMFANPPANCTFDPRWKVFGLPSWPKKPAHGTLPDR